MRFIVPGRIRGKGRPRFARRGNFVRTFTDANTVACEATVKHFASEAMRGRQLFEGPLWLSVAVWLVPPASWSKKRRSSAVYVTGRPDADNILKLIGDSLNGVVWADDSQLATIEISRRYTLRHAERVEIEIGRCGVELAAIPMQMENAA
jgi:Holliday junction resolvase RusA-like endonuclease